MRRQINFWMWSIREKLDLDKYHRIWNGITFFIGMFVILEIARLPIVEWIAERGFHYAILESKDTFFTQLSTSFIVISLTTILSSSTKQIYWSDKIELTLVKPMFSSFAAYATYTFASLLLSAYWCLIKSDKLYISFACSVLIMTSLTFKLIEVYFGNNKVKQTLEWYYEWLKEGKTEEYEETKEKMMTVMSKNMVENDFKEFFENFDFLYSMKEYESLCRVIEICLNYNRVLLEQILKAIWDQKREHSEYTNLLTELEFERVLNTMKEQKEISHSIMYCIGDIEKKMNEMRVG